MTEQMNEQYQAMVHIAERTLSTTWNSSVQLGHGVVLDSSPRSQMCRVKVLAGPPAAPTSVVLKRVLEVDGQTNEWIGLQFLTEIAVDDPLVPRFYAGDWHAGVLVMADLGDERGVHHYLLGQDATAAEHALLSWARTLGRMHASSMPHYAQYQRIRARLQPATNEHVAQSYRTIPAIFRQLTTASDVALISGLEEDLRALTQALTEPGLFYAYTQGDPCPDNNMLINGRCILFDFESGAFRHAMTDAIYARLGFPLCWCASRLPPQLLAAIERVYRSELVKGCPAATDDQLFSYAMVEGCAMALSRMHQLEPLAELLVEDRAHDYVTARQKMLFILDVFSQMTAGAGYLEALGETTRRMLQKLQTQWPDVTPMPYYPAFQHQPASA